MSLFVQTRMNARFVRTRHMNISMTNTCQQCSYFREVLCEEALQSTIGSHLLWSASTDTQEGMIGKIDVACFTSLRVLSISFIFVICVHSQSNATC
jgi:hypothetical protein